MSKKEDTKREEARKILKNGILCMSVERLIHLSHYGLMGNVILSSENISVENVFNRIEYDEENSIIMFTHKELQSRYGEISFSVDAISEISGCEDEENPDEYLNVIIKLNDGMNININILY